MIPVPVSFGVQFSGIEQALSQNFLPNVLANAWRRSGTGWDEKVGFLRR
jgi:hypothetical protein